MKNLFVVLMFVIFGSSVAHAGDQSSGCGLGWEIFKKNSLVSSAFRSTTNAIALNTIAMTSGTSGCSKHDIVMKQKAAIYYAEANYLKLQSEMAEGKGEHIQAFAKILGCNEAAAIRAGGVLQGNYEKIFTTDSVKPYEMLEESARSIYSSELASSGCSLGA